MKEGEEQNRGTSAEWIFSRCGGDWWKIKGRGRACRFEIIHWAPAWPGSDAALLIAPSCVARKTRRVAARLEIVLRFLLAIAHNEIPSSPPQTPHPVHGLVVWQPASDGSSTCGGLINQPSHWQPNRAKPIHEYFLVWVVCCTPARTLISLNFQHGRPWQGPTHCQLTPTWEKARMADGKSCPKDGVA